jgi:hypothetical protein
MKYKFVREVAISHDLDTVQNHLKGLRSLNYNPFFWWRLYTDDIKPLKKSSPLKDRILNGDFNPSTYYWQSQLVLHKAYEKVNLEKDDYQTQLEKIRLDLARHKRLVEDFEKEENSRLNMLYEGFTSSFKISEGELKEKLINWEGNIIEFYYYIEEFYHKTPKEIRKSLKN